MPLWFRIVRAWLPVAIVLSAACGLAYVGVQQSLRLGANDPQVQIAEDAVAQLDAGDAETDVVPLDIVNISASLAPFVIVYDARNEVIEGSGVFDGTPPVVPAGVLDTARSLGRNDVTWQPRPSVRIASVSVATKDGRVVLAGRSLREVEARIDQITRLAALAWIAGLLGSLMAVAAAEAFAQRWKTAE
jgi:hypothetical protein